MDDLNETAERHLSEAYWPWPLALAYCQPVSARREAVEAVVEVLNLYPAEKTLAEFTGSSAVARAFEVGTGQPFMPDGGESEYHRQLTEFEQPLTAAIRLGQLRSWGRETPGGRLQEIEPSDWVGAEIDGGRSSDLVREGWRGADKLSQALDEIQRQVLFYDVHLFGAAVRQLADALASAPATHADGLEGDFALIEQCVADAGQVRGGYWSPFVVGAWVASRDERFVAGVQLYEQRAELSRGGCYSASGWMALGDNFGERFNMTLTGALDDLREKLEDGYLDGGVAVDLASGETRPILRHEWTRWKVVHNHHGMSLLPGLYDFRWPSEAVRSAFPVGPRARASQTEELPDRAVVMSTGAALRECNDWLREKFCEADTKGWAKPAFRAAALERFDGRLSGRGFDQVWSAVVKEFPARAKAGAKPKSAQAI